MTQQFKKQFKSFIEFRVFEKDVLLSRHLEQKQHFSQRFVRVHGITKSLYSSCIQSTSLWIADKYIEQLLSLVFFSFYNNYNIVTTTTTDNNNKSNND